MISDKDRKRFSATNLKTLCASFRTARILRAIALRTQEDIRDGAADFQRLQAQWREVLKQIAVLAAAPR